MCLLFLLILESVYHLVQPYYRNYVLCDLGAMFEGAGFRPDTKIMASASKCLSFIKPESTETSSAPAATVSGGVAFNPSDN